MIIPPQELQPYIQVVPGEGLTIDDNAPDEIKTAFAIWIESLKDLSDYFYL